MKIKIFQIDLERDINQVAFKSLAFMLEQTGRTCPDSSLYELVYEGEVQCKDLEDVYALSNMKQPTNHREMCLNVSDITQVTESEEMPSGFYYCDPIGFKPVTFDPSIARKSNLFWDDEHFDFSDERPESKKKSKERSLER